MVAFWNRPIPFPVHSKHLGSYWWNAMPCSIQSQGYLRIAMGQPIFATQLYAWALPDRWRCRLVEVFGSPAGPTAEVDLEEVLRKADNGSRYFDRRWQVLVQDG